MKALTEIVINVLIVAIGVLISAIVSFYLTGQKTSSIVKEDFSSVYSEVEAAFVKNLKEGVDPELKNIKLYYEASSGESPESIESKSGFRKMLILLHFNMASGRIKEIKEEKYSTWLASIRNVIEQYETLTPYQDLDPVVRSIFQDISGLNENPKIEHKLRQLASVEMARFQELEATKSEARWSLIFGIASVVGALISIIIAIAQAISKNAINESR